MHTDPASRTVIVGGGIAALEALLALDDLAGARTRVTLVSPEPDFFYKPMTVNEPFDPQPADRRELRPVVEELGGEFVRAALAKAELGARTVSLDDGSQLRYDQLIVCVGGQAKAALTNATTFRSVGAPLEIDSLVERALDHPSKRLAFVVPHGVTWSLPIYELALMTRRWAEEHDLNELELVVVTPESAPLIIFGTVPSAAVAKLLAARSIEFQGERRAADEGARIVLTPQHETLAAGAIVALPVIEGRRLDGVPSDDGGFIPIDEHARIVGAENAWAAGDGTSFPIKQGGLATQQADAAAADIAARLGVEGKPEPFHPVLRGKLFIGAESLNLRHDVTGGQGEGTVSPDYLWWPPHKVSGRYLAPWLAKGGPPAEPPYPERSIDVDISMSLRWFEDPMALDPYGPIGVE